MNARSYRLVFSKRLGMHVPVSEVGHACRGKRRDRRSKARLCMLLSAALAAPAWALDPAALPSGAVVRSGDINFAQSANTLNVNQASQNGVIHWNSFNIGSQATVNFKQPNVTSATLNRITGNEASVIQGAMNATGAVYVINRNGILFDKSAQVNLHTLVASTLDIKDDDLFRNGYLSLDGKEAAFSDQYNSTGELNLAGVLGSVGVAEGAHIVSAKGGRIILMGADATNQGQIQTNGGQIILAAGQKAYFHTPLQGEASDSLLNGMVVMVESGGMARNLGTLSAGKGGDVTLIGAIVKQEGTATATTSVNVNGTIHLLAQHRTSDLNPSVSTLYNRPAADNTGEVVFGQASQTAIMPALDDGKVESAITAGKLTQQQIDDYYAGKARPADFYAYMPDDTVQDAQFFTGSRIFAQGRTIWVQQDASLVAPSGDITLFARGGSEKPDAYLVNLASSQSFLLQPDGAEGLCLECRVQVDDGARIDVSGLRDVQIDMERNVVEVELRGSELADSPLLHGENNAFYEAMYGNATNPLYGEKIKIDIRDNATVDINGQTVTRQGTALADASGYISQIGRKIDEKSTLGGMVNLYSEGGVVLRNGATIDISGGSLAYQDGTVTTSQLLYKGQLYDIATARPDRLYSGLGPERAVFEPGYMEGKDAGTLRIVAPATALQGSVQGTTITGVHQRGGTGDTLPKPGELILGLAQSVDAGLFQDYRLMGKVTFGKLSDTAPDFGTSLWVELSDEQQLALGRDIDLNQAMREIVIDPVAIKQNGIGRLSVYTNNVIELAAGQTLNVGVGGKVVLTGAQLDIGGQILAPGGEVVLKSKSGVYNDASARVGLGNQILDHHIVISGGIRTAGSWDNDYLDHLLHAAYKPVALNGGTISISTSDGGVLSLAQGSLLDASAGGWLKSDGSTLAGGKGGNIILKAEGSGATMKLDGDLRSYGVLDSAGKAHQGGALTIETAENIRIGDQAMADELRFGAGFFTGAGFSAYRLKSSLGDLTLDDGISLAPRTFTRVLSSGSLTRQSGSDMAGFSQATQLARDHVAKAERPATDLSLDAAYTLTVGKQASITLDALAELGLSAGNIIVNGSLVTPGGNMTLKAGEPGGFYAPNVSIWLGPGARLSVAGIPRTYRLSNGLIQGEVLDGGQLSLLTGGYFMAQTGAVLDASGAVGSIDLPYGVNGGITYVRNDYPSAGGSIRLAASEGLFLQEGAQLKARGGTEKAEAGSLQVELDRVLLSDDVTIATYPVDPATKTLYQHRLSLYSDATGATPAYLTSPGTLLQAADDASGILALSHLNNFENIEIKVGDHLVFKDSMALTPRGNLTLDAPNVILDTSAEDVQLGALYVNLGNADPLKQAKANPALVGNGVLTVNAELIDLTGTLSLSGVKQTLFDSNNDIRLAGVFGTTLAPVGRFSTAGDISFTASQVYATTLSEYTLESTKSGGKIKIAGLPGAGGGMYIPPVPLSGAGSVAVKADSIEQGGVLRAPLGSIELDAKDSLTLKNGSLTSVSAEGMAIPFGRVQNGRSWVYDFYTVDDKGNVVAKQRTIYSGDDETVDLKAKDIHLRGAEIDMQPEARVDLSGGGDLVGYEFAAGPGGSRDYLAQPGVFAIMPADNPVFAPADFQANQYAYLSANQLQTLTGVRQLVKPGAGIYLSAIPELGIKAGYYTLLPGRYALLPGAYAIRAVPGTTDMTASQNFGRQDGSYLAAGYMTSLGVTDTGVHRWSGFEVAGREVVATNKNFSFNIPAGQLMGQTLPGRSEIVDYRVGQLIPNVNQIYELALPKLADDAGRLSVNADNALTLDGQLDFSKPYGGLGGELDIASRKIAVTADGSAPHVADAGDYLILGVDKLASYDVDSLMIGGTREAVAGDASSLKVNQVAEVVLVETGTDKPLKAPEVMLVSKGSITLEAGSEVRGEGGGGLKHETLVFGDAAAGISGDGVLVRASSGDLRRVVRRNVSSAGNPADGLYTADNALVYGQKSVNLDATYTAFNLGKVGLGANGAMQLGATRVALGTVHDILDGVFVTNDLLKSLGNPQEIVLKSYSNFDVYGDATLGSADTRSLTLQGAGFAGIETGTLSIAAQSVELSNPDGSPLDATGAGGTGAIVVNADNILFGDGVVDTAGFDEVKLIARGEIAGTEGTGGMKTSNDLSMTAQRIVGYSGSNMSYTAGGKLTTAQYVAGTDEILPVLGNAPLGASMALLGGAGIEHGGFIDMPAGWLTLTAETGDIELLDGSKIFTGGVVRQFHGVDDSVNVYVAGGLTELEALAGDVKANSGATVDVGGRNLATSEQSTTLPSDDGKGSSDAGMLSIHANGDFDLQGELIGTISLPDESNASLTEAEKARRPEGGVLVVDAGMLNGGIVNLLAKSSGFGKEFDLRQRIGDLSFATGIIKAERVNLAADAGVLDVGGKIDASAHSGGWVSLAAGKELYLRNGAEIDASATGTNQPGGEVWLISGMDRNYLNLTVANADQSLGALVLKEGSKIDVSGMLTSDRRTTLSTGGRVHLQAPRIYALDASKIITGSGTDLRITQDYGVFDNNSGKGAIGTTIAGAALIEAIGNRVFDYSAVGSSQLNAIKSDSQSYMSSTNVSNMRSRLGGNATIGNLIDNSAFNVRPSVEIRSSGDLTFGSDYDLGAITAVAQNQPGTLTLRAAGNLLINGNLSDGFNNATGSTLDGEESWALRLVAGADLFGVNPMAVQYNLAPATGDFVLKGGKQIRTGTGSIQVAAAGDVEIGLSYGGSYGESSKEDASYDKRSVIYTAGRADTTTGFSKPNDSQFKAVYPVDGGALSIEAGGSIHAPQAPELMNQWLVRRGIGENDGSITTALTWGIDYRYFDQGVGALGGGNVRVRAGQDIENLSVSLPTTGRDYASSNIGTDILETGGGSLDVMAGGDIDSGVFYVQRGKGRVISGGSIGASEAYGAKNLLLAMGDATFQVDARTGLALESAFNPTVVPLSTNVSSILYNPKRSSYFFTYGQDSAINLASAQGDILLNNKMTMDDFLEMLQGVSVIYGGGDEASTNMFLIYPGSLRVAAVNGNLQVARDMWLYPSENGKLHLLASGKVEFGNLIDPVSEETTVATVAMSDQSPDLLSTVTNPGVTGVVAPDSALIKHAPVPVHLADPDPVRVYAEKGSIYASVNSGLVLPKPVEMLAGLDIVNTNVIGQNLSAIETSTLRAGRDIRYASPRSDSGLLQSNGDGLRIGGPGYLEIIAGRNIDLGTTGGMVSTGNLDNPNLGYGGANIVMMAGMGAESGEDGYVHVRSPHYEAFLSELGDQSKEAFYAELLDYERLRHALLDPANAGLSYKQVLDRLEDPSYRQAMTEKAMPEYGQSVAGFEALMASDVEALRAQAARRLYFSELQQAANEASVMKQLAALSFDLSKLNSADQAGVVEGFNATLATSGLPVSSLEKIARFFGHVAELVKLNKLGNPGYDVLGALGYMGRANPAIGLMFAASDYAGDFNGFYSQVRTEQGNDIDMLMPGGAATVGLVNAEKVSGTGAGGYRPESTFGLYTVNGGSIRSYAQGDFLVNSSRVFTLGWEATLNRTPMQYLLRDDIFLYSELGNVDAGKGAKTASSAPPPTFITDAKGYTKSDIGKSISGSGIGVLLVRNVINRGDTFLIAPNGEVNAGDAGIRASGNLFIDANRIVGADNIVAIGLSIGMPAAVDTSGLSISGVGGLGDAAQAASEATASLASSSEEAQKTAQAMKQALANFRPSFITVEVLGFGMSDPSGKAGDEEEI